MPAGPSPNISSHLCAALGKLDPTSEHEIIQIIESAIVPRAVCSFETDQRWAKSVSGWDLARL